MKRVINKVFLSLLLFSLYPCAGNSTKNLLKDLSALQSNEIDNFHFNLKKICSSGVFYQNLKNHESYPFFGTISNWKKKCNFLSTSNEISFKKFFLNNFKFLRLSSNPGLLTGYYEPTINVSEKKDNIYRYPILKKSKKFVNKPREKIERDYNVTDVLLWTDDKINLFFLHIQGSGLGKFSDNKIVKINYNGNNSLPYTSIGKYLKENKLLESTNIDLFSIKNWLKNNPSMAQDVLNLNKRFIFFKKEKINLETHAIGAVGLPLTPDNSIAVDKRIYPLGLPFLIKFVNRDLIKPVLSLDTGSAIVGSNRADLFTGRGETSEKKAGTLKKKIYLYSVIPYDK